MREGDFAETNIDAIIYILYYYGELEYYMQNNNKFIVAVRSAFPHTLPVLTGFLVLGIAYGILMQTKGYGAFWSVLMSGVAFCGSMQFVAITLLTTAFDPVQAFFLSFLVNARHLFYGIAMLGKYRGMGKAKLFLIYTLCDETFSVVSSVTVPSGVGRKDFYIAISLLHYIYWVLGSLLGGLIGRFVTWDTRGLDFALTALFVVLFMEQLRHKDNRVAGLIGLSCTALSLIIFGAAQMVIPAMGLILLVLIFGRKFLCI